VRKPRWPLEPEYLRGGNDSAADSEAIEMAAGAIPSFPEAEWDGKGAAVGCDRNDPACRGRTAFQAADRGAALSGTGLARESVGVAAPMPPQFKARSANNITSGPSAERTKPMKRLELAIGRSIQRYVTIEAHYDKALPCREGGREPGPFLRDR
jgi:hypothetical protein